MRTLSNPLPGLPFPPPKSHFLMMHAQTGAPSVPISGEPHMRTASRNMRRHALHATCHALRTLRATRSAHTSHVVLPPLLGILSDCTSHPFAWIMRVAERPTGIRWLCANVRMQTASAWAPAAPRGRARPSGCAACVLVSFVCRSIRRLMGRDVKSRLHAFLQHAYTALCLVVVSPSLSRAGPRQAGVVCIVCTRHVSRITRMQSPTGATCFFLSF